MVFGKSFLKTETQKHLPVYVLQNDGRFLLSPFYAYIFNQENVLLMISFHLNCVNSKQVAFEELEHILKEVKTHILSSPNDPSPVRTIAGGSVANTIRGLSVGFGINCGIIGAHGDDEQGRLFVNNMSFNGINLSRLRMKKGPTGQVRFHTTTSQSWLFMSKST